MIPLSEKDGKHSKRKEKRRTANTSLGGLADLVGGEGGVEVERHEEGDLGSQGLQLGLVGDSHLRVRNRRLQVGLFVIVHAHMSREK